MCIELLLLSPFQYLKKFGSMKNKSEWSTKRNILGRILMYLSLASNAIAVAVGTLIAYLLEKNGSTPFLLTGEVGEGIPPFELPPFSTAHNGTEYDFGDMVKEYGSTLAFLPLVAILESVAIAKAFCKVIGYSEY